MSLVHAVFLVALHQENEVVDMLNVLDHICAKIIAILLLNHLYAKRFIKVHIEINWHGFITCGV